MHKTDVPKTSDLAGFAAREAGQGWDLGYNKPDGDNDMKIKFAAREAGEPMRVKHLPGDLRDAIMEQMRAMGEAPSILGVCADDPEEEAARPRTTHEQIESTCNDIRDMLLAKNRKYGDSALDPVRIFSKATPVEQILVRLDDKLSRIQSAQADEDEDVIDDLIGYLVLLKIARAR